MFKGRLTSKGDVIAKEEIHGSRHGQYWGFTRHFNFGYDNGDVYRIKNMVHSGEGCRVPGYVWVNRVPGNIRLWTYSHAYLFCSLCQETQDINVSHHVDHVSFGTDTVINFVKEHFAGTGVRVTSRRGAPGGRNRVRPQQQRPARNDFTAPLGGTLARPLEGSSSASRRWCPCAPVHGQLPTILPAGRCRPYICCLVRDELRLFSSCSSA